MGHVEYNINTNYVNAIRLLTRLESENKISHNSKNMLVIRFTDCFIRNKKRQIVEKYFSDHIDNMMSTLLQLNNKLRHHRKSLFFSSKTVHRHGVQNFDT